MGRGVAAARVLAAGTVAAVALLAAGSATAENRTRAAERVLAVSIDPADYLSETPDASALAKRLVRQFEENGVNAIYVNAYNVQYGAYYRTEYAHNVESDYGRQDLLGKLLSAAHARDLRVFAALYDHQHRGAWETHPSWRQKTESGGDYNPPGTDIQYYLSTGNPQAADWWRGFLTDLLDRYPELDGVELREPIVNWWGTTADYNPALTRAFRAAHPDAPLGGETWRAFRQETLTRFLRNEIELVQGRGLAAHVTTVATTSPTGTLMPATWLARETGFDLDGLLDGRIRPDAIKVELIWQQWARLYGRVVFTPEWTRTALRAFLRQVDGRASVVTHVELTDFGRSRISVEEFLRTLRAADLPATSGLDFYSSSLADAKEAWPAVRAVYGAGAGEPSEEIPGDRRILVLHDEGDDESDRRTELARLQEIELVNLVDHFDLKWDARPVDEYRRGDLADFEAVVYLGSRHGNAPDAFVSDVSVFERTVVWVGQNLFQLSGSGVVLPFEQGSRRQVAVEGPIRYRGASLPAKGELLPTRAREGASVVATITGPDGDMPYILRSGRFWYVAGSPFSFLELAAGPNGRYLVFSDALHDMLGVAHSTEAPRALLGVGGIDPLTEPARIRQLAGAFASERVPFVFSVTPFHVDPERDRSVPLSEKPELVAALRDAVARGGAIVAHGATHQYRGRTGDDAEFWDLVNGGGIAEDGDAYVRDRVQRSLDELWANELHPLAWQTPAYRATRFDYTLFAEAFSTFFERRVYGVVDGQAYVQPLPFAVEADVYGGRILPENLGHLAAGATDASTLETAATRLRVVRDAVAGASVDVSVSPDVVRSLVARIRGLGYRFVDLYSLPNVVEAPGRVELTGAGTATLAVPSGFYLEERALDRSEAVLDERLTGYPSYMRTERTFGETPGTSLLSLRVLSADELEALRGEDGLLPWSGSTAIGFALSVLAVAGLVVLLGVYAAARLGMRGGSYP